MAKKVSPIGTGGYIVIQIVESGRSRNTYLLELIHPDLDQSALNRKTIKKSPACAGLFRMSKRKEGKEKKGHSFVSKMQLHLKTEISQVAPELEERECRRESNPGAITKPINNFVAPNIIHKYDLSREN
jgi:hypothetical protein